MAKAKVKKPLLYTIVLHRLFFYFWNVTHPHIYFPKKNMQKLGNIQAPAPNLFSWKCTAWVEKKSNMGRQVMFFPLAQWVPHVKRTWHKVGHPPSEAQQQMDWLRMSTAAKICKCQNRIKHISWGKWDKKKYVWKWEPEIRTNVEGSEIKSVYSMAVKTSTHVNILAERIKRTAYFLMVRFKCQSLLFI